MSKFLYRADMVFQAAISELKLARTPVSEIKIRECIILLNKVREMKHKKREADIAILVVTCFQIIQYFKWSTTGSFGSPLNAKRSVSGAFLCIYFKLIICSTPNHTPHHS